MQSKAKTVSEYLKNLPEDRRKIVSAVRKEIKKNLPAGFKETMQYGMIGYSIPLSKFPNTYNGQPLAVAALASKKSYVSLHLMAIYGNPKLLSWFQGEWKKSGKKLNMGKACIHFTKLDDVPLEVIGKAISKVSVADMIAIHETWHGTARKKQKD